MKIAKWGNSLAVRLPATLVEELQLQEGDEIRLSVKNPDTLEVTVEASRQQALERIRSLRVPMPAGFKFNREEAHERGHREEVEAADPGAAAD